MDDWSARLANRLAGNPDGAAVVEVTWTGPVLIADRPVRLAVAGASFEVIVDGRCLSSPFVVSVSGGGRIEFGRRHRGTRAYLAVRGGIDVPAVLGSRATDVRSKLGPLGGRRLARGDRLPVREAMSVEAGLRELRAPSWMGSGSLRVVEVPSGAGGVMFGALCAARYRLSAASDRTGYRLTPDRRLEGASGTLMSQPVVAGAIQVPPDGEPVLLMADRQTAGGYPVPAVVVTADLPVAGQLGPSDACTFVACGLDEAQEAALARERELDLLAERCS
jgi:antagonist of KipI